MQGRRETNQKRQGKRDCFPRLKARNHRSVHNWVHAHGWRGLFFVIFFPLGGLATCFLAVGARGGWRGKAPLRSLAPYGLHSVCRRRLYWRLGLDGCEGV